MLKLFLAAALVAAWTPAEAKPRILAVKPLKSFSYSKCHASIVGPFRAKPGDQVLRYKITYNTTDAMGQSTIASGLVAFTDHDLETRRPLNYNHATVVDKQNVPTAKSWETKYVLCNFIKKDNVFIAADYLGLGDATDTFQSYLHLPSEVANNIHLMEAAEELLARRNTTLEKQWIMAGYSQGAHVALATHKWLDETKHRDWVVTNTIAMSGPYNLSGYGFDALYKDPKKDSATLFTALVIYAYQSIYGDLFTNISEVFRPKYRNFFEVMATQKGRKIKRFLPKYPHQLLTKEYIQAVAASESHPLRQALKRNNLLPWKTSAKIIFIYSDGDRTVLSNNSHSLAKAFEDLGVNVLRKNMGKRLSHVGAFFPAMYFGVSYRNQILNSRENLK